VVNCAANAGSSLCTREWFLVCWWPQTAAELCSVLCMLMHLPLNNLTRVQNTACKALGSLWLSPTMLRRWNAITAIT